jgi:tetratricopeptide (TPR) repeat protein
MDIDEMLLSRVSQVGRGRERVDAVELALAAALAGDEEQRAWALVSLGAELRRQGDSERAFRALDGAGLRGSDEARSAAFTCAAATHRDLGDLTRARRAGEEALALHDSDYARNRRSVRSCP